VSERIVPVQVTFWRCGIPTRGRGWRRCSTPEQCQAEGCVLATPKEEPERADI
jgi:hypothetical protein